jgi:hypothetical protein
VRDGDVRPTLQAHLPQLRLPPRLLGPVNGLWTLDAGLSTRECGEGPLAPTADFGAHAHTVPVFGAVPANLLFAKTLVDTGGARGLGEVDQVYMLAPRPNVLELHPRGATELHRVRNVLALVAHELHPQAGLFEDFADGRIIRELVLL